MIKKLKKPNSLIWAALIIFLICANFFQKEGYRIEKTILFSEFLSKLQNQQIKSVKIKGNEITGKLSNSIEEKFKTYGAFYPDLIKELRDQKVEIEVLSSTSNFASIISIIASLAPILLLGVFWFFIARQMQNAGGLALLAKGLRACQDCSEGSRNLRECK